MAYNPAILREALKARSLTASELSARLNLAAADVASLLEDKSKPGMGILGDVARELSIPKFAFFMTKIPELAGTLPDFRSDKPKVSPKSRQTVEAIQFAEGVQRMASELEVPAARTLPALDPKAAADGLENAALGVRDFLGLTLEDQINSKDDNAFYTVVRKRIEDAGVFVLHASFPATDGSGFCLSHAKYPVILVNTKSQTRGRRLFTLVHELAHLLLGVSGISDPFVRENATERHCNRFAGAFLVPGAYVKTLLRNTTPPKKPSLTEVLWASRRLKISQQATVLRLEELGVYDQGSHSHWLAQVTALGLNPDYRPKQGGGGAGPPPQEKTKLAKYGFHFASAFADKVEAGLVSEIALYRSSGLKPAYQRAYFDYALSLTSDQLRDLELEDE